MTPPLDFAAQLARFGLKIEEIEESFARASGPGGQHVNKVSTAVTLRHPGTDIAVTVQDSRSQARNRELARERFIEALEARRSAKRQQQRAEHEKTRRRNRPRPRGVARRILDSKKKRGALKKLRSKINEP